MADAIFENPQLVAVYDAFDAPRDDLDLYTSLAEEVAASAVIDLGCGTGVLARRLARAGRHVLGIDPARASIDLAKAHAAEEGLSIDHRVGTAADIPTAVADLVTMTGNVAQVFLSLDDLRAVFADCARGLRSGGHLVVETRDPAVRAWESWGRRQPRTLDVDGIGEVTETLALGQVDLPFVSFSHLYRFAATGDVIGSRSRLRFHEQGEVASALEAAGFAVRDIRDAPDRPGAEWVFLAQKR
ncbi:class I SAM-dependent methyltransferase [Brevibacterium celere]|uniref:class I SAM-dependent methyltransferase n=1 Tax=Brevibacterium celere TaxID=225845 RepID=UPI0031CE41B5